MKNLKEILQVKYRSILEREIQQCTSARENYCSILPGRGKEMEVPCYKAELKPIGNSFVEANPHELALAKRVVRPEERYGESLHKDGIDINDLESAIADFVSEQKNGIKRLLDQVILGVVADEDNAGQYRVRDENKDTIVGGLLAKNYTGNSGATLTALDDALTVPFDFKMDGSKNAKGFILDQIVEARRRLQANWAYDPAGGDELCVAITSQMQAQMIMWEQQQNRNYGFTVLTNGQKNVMLGCRFLVTDMLPYDSDGNRICPVWVKNRLLLCPWDQTKFDIVRLDKDLHHPAIRIKFKCMFGATRKDERSFATIRYRE